MKKFLIPLLSGLTVSATAGETVVQHPEFWSPITEHQVNRDVPQYLGFTDNVGLLTSSFAPDSVSSGYLGFLQSSQTIANLILASIVAVAILFAVFVLFNGRAKLTEGFSGKMIDRWSPADVVLHWCVVIPCVILILTGVVVGAGKVWLAPMMTPTHFESLVYASVMVHNIFALPFLFVAVILMVKWAKKQTPEACDGKWFLALGGYVNFGNKQNHPDAGFANAGEKAFFWCFVLFGLCLGVTGVMLLFPELFGGLTKNSALLALVIHIVSAIVLGAFSVVHIFMGAVMSEGGMQNMINGQCDENWAKQNHNLWYAKLQNK